jgi:hypothetical protein
MTMTEQQYVALRRDGNQQPHVMNSFTQLVQHVKNADWSGANQIFSEIMQQKTADRIEVEKQTVFKEGKSVERIMRDIGSHDAAHSGWSPDRVADEVYKELTGNRNKNRQRRLPPAAVVNSAIKDFLKSGERPAAHGRSAWRRAGQVLDKATKAGIKWNQRLLKPADRRQLELKLR